MKRPRLPDRTPIAEDVIDLGRRATRAPSPAAEVEPEKSFTVTLPASKWAKLSDLAAERTRTTRKRVGVLNVARDLLIEKLEEGA